MWGSEIDDQRTLSTDVGEEGTSFKPDAGDGLVYTACGYFRSAKMQMINGE
jgi:hypothetical protein